MKENVKLSDCKLPSHIPKFLSGIFGKSTKRMSTWKRPLFYKEGKTDIAIGEVSYDILDFDSSAFADERWDHEHYYRFKNFRYRGARECIHKYNEYYKGE